MNAFRHPPSVKRRVQRHSNKNQASSATRPRNREAFSASQTQNMNCGVVNLPAAALPGREGIWYTVQQAKALMPSPHSRQEKKCMGVTTQEEGKRPASRSW